MSLLAHYTLNGTPADLTGTYPGTPIGSFTYSNGFIGECADFTSGAISTTLEDAATPTFSFATWFKKTTTWAESTGVAGTRSGTTGWMLYRNSGDAAGFLRWYSHYVTTSDTITSYNAWPDITGMALDTWYHICVTRSADGFVKIYLNGNIVENQTPPANFKAWSFSTQEWHVGSGNPGSSSWYSRNQQLDDFRIYDHVLSEKEIGEIYKGLATYLTFNDGSVSEASGNSTGIVENNVVYTKDTKTGEYCFEGDGTVRTITLTDSPVVTKNQTIAMWLYPTSFAERRNPWNKNYGGEGTITQEPSGVLNYYWGTNGGNGTPYQALTSTTPLTLNQWNHIAIVRDLDATTLTWYINNVVSGTATTAYPESAVSVSNLTIGDGYVFPYHGRIADVRQYATALSANSVSQLYQTGLSVDNTGRMHSKYFAESGIVTPNLLDYTTWTIGTSGSQTGFSRNGSDSENFIVEDNDPFGKQVAVWEARPDATSGADGGWNGSLRPADSSKLYRFSVWIRRTVLGGGTTYFGLNESGGVVINRSSGSTNTNPYFRTTSAGGFTEGEWQLWVGHLWPAGSGTGSNKPDTGVWTVSGGQISTSGTDYVFDPNITSILHRAYLYYTTNTATRQQFVYPRIDLVDGTEPSINALISGFDSNNYDRVHDELGAGDVSDNFGVEYGKTNIGRISEVGIIDEAVTYLPFRSDTNDKTEFNNDATLFNGALINSKGLFVDGVNDFARISQPALDFTSHHWTMSFWIYPYSFDGSGMVVCPSSNGVDQFVRFISTGIRFQYTEAADLNGRFIDAPININEWSHIAVQIEPDFTTYLYVNGVLANSATNTSPIAFWTGSWDLGRRANGTIYSTFNMKEFKIFDRVLTAEEVAQEYNSSLRSQLSKSTAFSSEFIEV